MNKKISFGAALALLLIVAAFVFSITMIYATQDFNTRVTDLRSRERMYEKYAEIDRVVRLNYNGDINETRLNDSIANGFIEGIGDDYGRYISAEEYKRLLQDDGDHMGIGAEVSISPDDFYLLVNEVYPDSPAEIAGIEAGDLIVRIDGTDLSRENSRQMLESLQGPAGSKITIVTRRGSVESGQLEMTRRAVSVPTVLHCRLLEDSTVGYMYIKEFTESTYDQFNRELLRLMDDGATSLIIDVRDNSSDTLRSTTRILDKLLPAGVLVSAVYKGGATEVLADSDANAIDLPLVVLTNSGTTGTAELFAQVIKDFDKGRTVGTGTAGKGVMQNIIQLSDGSALELSVAFYLTASGQTYHETGVKADYDVQWQIETPWTELIDNEHLDMQLVKAKEVAVGMQRSSDSAAAADASQTEAETEPPTEATADATENTEGGEEETTDGEEDEESAADDEDALSDDEESSASDQEDEE